MYTKAVLKTITLTPPPRRLPLLGDYAGGHPGPGGHLLGPCHWPLRPWQPPLLRDAANTTLQSETVRETVCDAIIANGAV